MCIPKNTYLNDEKLFAKTSFLLEKFKPSLHKQKPLIFLLSMYCKFEKTQRFKPIFCEFALTLVKKLLLKKSDLI